MRFLETQKQYALLPNSPRESGDFFCLVVALQDARVSHTRERSAESRSPTPRPSVCRPPSRAPYLPMATSACAFAHSCAFAARRSRVRSRKPRNERTTLPRAADPDADAAPEDSGDEEFARVRQIKSKRRQESSVQPSFGRCGVFGFVHESGSRCMRVAK